VRKPESKIGVCSYHLCRKRTKVFLCKYCGKYFCEQHIEPKPVLTLNQISTAKEPLRSKLEEIWRSNKGHPDSAFTPIFWNKLEKEEKEKLERAWEALDILKEGREPAVNHEEEPIERKVLVPEKIENYWYWNKRKIIKTIVVIVLFSIVGYFLYNGFQSGQIQSFLSNIANETSKWQNIISSEPKYVQDCLEKAKEAIELERIRSPIDFKWKILEYKEFSYPSEAEAYAKDRVTFPGSYVICKKKCSFTECKDIILPTKILAIIYEERGYFQGSEIKSTVVMYCGDDGRILEKGSTDTCIS
jgi:hypothetical protein